MENYESNHGAEEICYKCKHKVYEMYDKCWCKSPKRIVKIFDTKEAKFIKAPDKCNTILKSPTSCEGYSPNIIQRFKNIIIAIRRKYYVYKHPEYFI